MDVLEKFVSHDLEFNGKIASALHNGHDFAFWLAQLGPWVDERPQIEKQEVESVEATTTRSYYRNPSLAADNKDFDNIQVQSHLINQQAPNALRLWQSMHPDPLSLYNDATRLDDEIIENCELHVRERLQQKLQKVISPDPTLLEEIIPIERSFLQPAY